MTTFLTPEEFDASYFDGALQRYAHNAGWSRYQRYYRINSTTSTGEKFRDIATGVCNELKLVGKKVLELGCAKGFIVKDLRDLNVDAYGLDVSRYAIGQCEEGMSPYLTVGNATDLSAYADNEFDYIISFRMLECLSDTDINSVLSQCAAKGLKQAHVVSLDARSDYYQQKSLQSWLDDYNWPSGTIIAPNEDWHNYMVKA